MQQLGITFDFQLGTITHLPYQNAFFDTIMSLGVIDHLARPHNALREFYRVTKPAGRLILMTPNRHSMGRLERIIRQAMNAWPFGYQREYAPHERAALAEAAGFTVTLSTAALRQVFRHDSRSLRWIAKIDRLISVLMPTWGFYSYVIATKKGGVR
jgi:ubiquinone/menaquinone biosynthesis C-methylase UbiE